MRPLPYLFVGISHSDILLALFHPVIAMQIQSMYPLVSSLGDGPAETFNQSKILIKKLFASLLHSIHFL
jgi:hypothetical protein